MRVSADRAADTGPMRCAKRDSAAPHELSRCLHGTSAEAVQTTYPYPRLRRGDGTGLVHSMTALSTRSLLILTVALLVPAVASVWLMAVPQTMTSSTYSMGAILLVAIAARALVRDRLADATVPSAPRFHGES